MLAHGVADSQESATDGPLPKLAPVSGKLTYDDGSPVPGHRIQIVFIPLVPEGQSSNRDRPSIADVNAEDGTFKVASTYEEGDGATVGMHRIMVTVLGLDGKLSDAIPRVFADPRTTPLKIEIEDRKNWIHFQVPRP
jgi:hypothetical protein